MDYGPGWVPPWRPGLPQARCTGRLCVGEGIPGKLCVAITLDAEGRCAQCARTPASEDEQRLRLDVAS